MSLAFHLTPINSTLLKVQAADGGDVNEKLVIRYLQGNVHIYILYIYIYMKQLSALGQVSIYFILRL